MENTMSRAYRVSVSESLRQIIRGSDHVGTDIEMLEVLPKEQMAELLAAELEGRGFRREGKILTRKQAGITISIDAATGRATVTAELCEEIELNQEATGWGDEDWGATGRSQVEEQLRERARAELAKQANTREERLTQTATAHLEGVLRDLQGELDAAVNRVTAQALKTKAAQMGEIKQITEDPENGTMTIVLEV